MARKVLKPITNWLIEFAGKDHDGRACKDDSTLRGPLTVDNSTTITDTNNFQLMKIGRIDALYIISEK